MSKNVQSNVAPAPIQTDGKTQSSERERKIINFQLAKIEFSENDQQIANWNYNVERRGKIAEKHNNNSFAKEQRKRQERQTNGWTKEKAHNEKDKKEEEREREHFLLSVN